MKTTRTIMLELTEQEARWLQRALLENYSEADENYFRFKLDLWGKVNAARAEMPPHAPRTKCPQKRFNPP